MGNFSQVLTSAKLPGLLGLWEATIGMESSTELTDVRGCVLSAIEARAPEGFTAWLEQDAPRDEDLRRFVMGGE